MTIEAVEAALARARDAEAAGDRRATIDAIGDAFRECIETRNRREAGNRIGNLFGSVHDHAIAFATRLLERARAVAAGEGDAATMRPDARRRGAWNLRADGYAAVTAGNVFVPARFSLYLLVPAGYVDAVRAAVARGRARAITPLDCYMLPEHYGTELRPFHGIGSLQAAVIYCEVADELAQDGDPCGARWAVLAGALRIDHDSGADEQVDDVLRRLISAAWTHDARGIAPLLRAAAMQNNDPVLAVDVQDEIARLERELPEDELPDPFRAVEAVEAMVAAGTPEALSRIVEPQGVPLPVGWPFPAGTRFERVGASSKTEVIVVARADQTLFWLPLVLGERGWRLQVIRIDREAPVAQMVARAASAEDDAILFSILAAAHERRAETARAFDTSDLSDSLVLRWLCLGRPLGELLVRAVTATGSRAMVEALRRSTPLIDLRRNALSVIVEALADADRDDDARTIVESVVAGRFADLVASVRGDGRSGPSPDGAGKALARILLALPRWYHERSVDIVRHVAERDWPSSDPEGSTHARWMGEVTVAEIHRAAELAKEEV
jgi:hypothetical protein